MAHLALSEGTGQIGVKLGCQKKDCGCEAFYSIEELIKLGEEIGKGNGEQAASSENRAA
jgi:hypothetical protein